MTVRERDPFKVLISCILSLRTQDKTTEEASRRLFQIAETPEALAEISVDRIQRAIYPVGFYRVKGQRIKDLSREIIRNYAGRVPDSIEELLKLKGVGRKTANLVVTVGYNRDGICVDTHVHRITNRWGLIKTQNPNQTEFSLREILPKKYWKTLNRYLVSFGQGVCKPVSPLCSQCRISKWCEKAGVTRSR
jgi:endonuclease-3